MRSSLRFPLIFATLAVAILLASCGVGGRQYLYVADGVTGAVAQYALPLTNTAIPQFTLTVSAVDGLAVDGAGNLVVGSGYPANAVSIFKAPVSTRSVATSWIPVNAGVWTVTLNGAGDLFVPNFGSPAQVALFRQPLSSLSTSAHTIASGLHAPVGSVVDPSGNLIVADLVGGAALVVFASPYTAAPAVITPVAGDGNTFYGQPAICGTQLFVPVYYSNATGGSVAVFNLPLAASSTPAYSIANLTEPHVVTFDRIGNLYVGGGDGTVRVFAAPFSASSEPVVTLTNAQSSGYPWHIWGLAVTQ